jgi:hypothetical protein
MEMSEVDKLQPNKYDRRRSEIDPRDFTLENDALHGPIGEDSHGSAFQHIRTLRAGNANPANRWRWGVLDGALQEQGGWVLTVTKLRPPPLRPWLLMCVALGSLPKDKANIADGPDVKAAWHAAINCAELHPLLGWDAPEAEPWWLGAMLPHRTAAQQCAGQHTLEG